MLVVRISQWDREGAEKKRKTPSFILLIETLPSVQMVIRTHTPFASPEMVAAVAISGRLISILLQIA